MRDTLHPQNLPLHPLTGVRAIGFTRRGPVWPVRGGSDPAPTPPPAVPPAPTPPPTPSPAPADPAYTPPQTQADLDRLIGERLARDRRDRADYDDLKADAEKWRTHKDATATPDEKARETAWAEARAEERAALTPELVRAEFRAAAKGILSDQQRDALLEDLDLAKYLTAAGAVDVAKVEAKVTALAPTEPRRVRFPDLGQGPRPGSVQPGVAAGRDLYAQSRPKSRSGS
jgi:hypothetical protein